MRAFLATAGIAAIGIAVLLAPAAVAQGDRAPSFKKGAVLSDGHTGYSMSVSEDGKAATIVFDGLVLELDGVGAPPFATRAFSLAMPLTGARRGVKLNVFFQGFVFRLKGTDASLITTVNGRPHVMDFAQLASAPREQLENEQCGKIRQAYERDKGVAKLSAKREQPAIAAKPSESDPDVANNNAYMQCLSLDLPPTADLRLNAVLVLNNRNRDAAGHLDVTSIDLDLQPAGG
jgi:hypothetical protein